jgi:Ser-tRNA(Ala) deacylase AlaX
MTAGTRKLFLDDAYARTAEATVVEVRHEGKKTTVVLDQTLLQPSHRDGGDRGTLAFEGGREVYVGTVAQSHHHDLLEHRIKGKHDIAPGARVAMTVDWEHRYQLMRQHTANHLLYATAKVLLGSGFPAVSKTSVAETYTHWMGQGGAVDDDFIAELGVAVNNLVGEDRAVVAEELPRAEAIRRAGEYTADIIPGTVDTVRVVTIENLDADPCIGLHVARLGEIGEIEIVDVQRVDDDVRVLSRLAPTAQPARTPEEAPATAQAL